MINRVLYWLVLGIVSVSVVAPAAQAGVFVSGRVISANTREPAAEVTLSLYPPDDPMSAVDVSQSLKNGAFVLRIPKAGQYRLTIDSPDYVRYNQMITIPQAGLGAFEIRLQHLPSIRLRLLAPDGRLVKSGLAEAWITMDMQSGGLLQLRRMVLPARARANVRRRMRSIAFLKPVRADGTLDITIPTGIPDDDVDMIVGARCANVGGCGEIRLNKWPQEIVTIPLNKGATLSGTVLDRKGRPAAHATVMIVAMINDGPLRVRDANLNTEADENGHFEVPALVPGNYLVRARGVDGTRFSQTVTLTPEGSVVKLGPDDSAP